ncbi:uncharacterized protein LOC132799248 [Ziziphus jujuba]|uniref:Uncharacterized protein LOC132799248 n=2 Tax=Ziziphus jujuba TaxID=326968 RepID=A0ABM3ZYY7_ZIZJJ|nr:uncharacterized protein LOC132799248 [Ziziphus jujuba]
MLSSTSLPELTFCVIREKPSDPDVFRCLEKLNINQRIMKEAQMQIRVLHWCLNISILKSYVAVQMHYLHEAVNFLLASQQQLQAQISEVRSESSTKEAEVQKVDPVQVDLLVGKAYSDWGHVSDAVAVYDQLISAHPDDFRAYLAKATSFAPEKAKVLVHR